MLLSRITRSPAATRWRAAAMGPMCSTRPTISWPRIIGSGADRRPLAYLMSVPQLPHSSTRTTALSSRSSGGARSRSSKVSGAVRTSARTTRVSVCRSGCRGRLVHVTIEIGSDPPEHASDPRAPQEDPGMPSPIDLVLHGARVMTPEGMVRADVLVRDGRILGLEDDATGRPAIETIDVSGQVLLPGLIDSHAHLRQPGHEHKEDIEHGTRAAAAGGYTTVIGMPNVNPVTSDVERYRAAIALYEASSCVDFNHFPTGTDVAAVPGLAAAGALGYKIYMIGDAGRDYLRQPGLGVTDHGALYDIADAIAATGLPMLVHPHDQELMRSIEVRFHARGERDHRAFARAYAMHGGMVWDTA